MNTQVIEKNEQNNIFILWSLTTDKATRLFSIFAMVYLFCYCAIPYIYSVTIWPDSAQMFAWSQHFAWGYHEHPWVPPFVINLFTRFTHYSPLGIYMIGGILNVMACWGVWRLGRKFLPEDCALVGALLLSSYLLTGFFLGQVNNNTFNFGLWPIMYLCFYNALVTQKSRHWIAAGIVTGLATLSKYYTIFPLACIGLFILFDKKARQSFGKQGIYWGIFFYLIVLLPHILWLFDNNFASIHYAVDRSESHDDLLSQLNISILFSLSQFGNFGIPFILLAIIYFSCPRYINAEWKVSQFNKHFLTIVAWGPFLLTIILSTIFGWNLPNEWGEALPCLWSLSLISWILPKFSPAKFNIQLKMIYGSMLILMLSSMIFLAIESRYKPYIAINFPATEAANLIKQDWDTHYQTPLKYIISSDEYIGGMISFYSPDHPDVFSNDDECINPVKKADLVKYGAMIFITDGFGGHFELNEAIKKMKQTFPNLIILPVRYVDSKKSPSNDSFPKTKLWTAILPPNHSSSE